MEATAFWVGSAAITRCPISAAVSASETAVSYTHLNAPTNINGVIRLDYAPVWMAAGLIFEKILSK